MFRYDLRIRYIPSDVMEAFEDDRTTMLYFYQQVRTSDSIILQLMSLILRGKSLMRSCSQVRSDYMQNYASKVSEGMALQLGCLEIR